jgi:NDP-sugar pyrophosphorylase family protein
VKLGNYVTLGDGVRLGNGVRLGDGVRLGNGVRLGDYVTLGNGARVLAGSDAIDLGWADGYRKCIAQVNGVAHIGAGCRWFTLADALKHWEPMEDRVMTMCLIQSAVFIAGYKGWSHE